LVSGQQAYSFIAEVVKDDTQSAESVKLASAQCREGDLKGLYEKTERLAQLPSTNTMDVGQLTESLQIVLTHV
jgi:hypothetical protein